MSANEAPVPSPCINICSLDMDDVCVGCYRTGDEVFNWGSYSEAEKRAVMENVMAREEAAGCLMVVKPGSKV